MIAPDRQQSEIAAAVATIMAARPTFKVGDRVRVRLDGECCAVYRSWSGVGHPPVHDGQAGTVVASPPTYQLEYPPDETLRTHPITVRFDHWITVEGRTFSGSWFAPTELERIEP